MSEESKTIMEEQEETSENTMPPPLEKSIEIEKIEEQKLKSKFPGKILLILNLPIVYTISERYLLKKRYFFSHWRTSSWWWRSLCLPPEETWERPEVFRLG